MKNQSFENFDYKLPYGRELNDLLIQPNFTEASVRKFLQEKGVYYGRKDKKLTIPIISSMILSPTEYEEVREQQSTKENNPKRRSEQWNWNSKTKLFDEIPKDFDIKKIIDTKFKGYEIDGNPKFIVEDTKDKALLKFKIRRIDRTKNWCNDKLEFDGQIEFEVEADGSTNVVKITTSSETDEVCDAVISNLRTEFKNRKCIRDEKTDILFSSFSNKERIQFFWQLTGSISSNFINFQEICDIDVKPDNHQKFPKNLSIDWMEKTIKKLSLSGQGLQDTFFITDTKCHPYLIIWKMEANFRFHDHVAKGSCRICFDFPKYNHSNINAEFSISISSIKLDRSSNEQNKLRVKNHLLKQVDKIKIETFKKTQP